MSSNAPQLPQDDPWRPRRVHGGLRQLWRGRKDKQWHFRAQEPDEVVRLMVRKHWLFLVRPALPLVAAITLLFLVFALQVRNPGLSSTLGLLELLLGIIIVIAGLYFVWRDFLLWWREVDIITNKRILTWRGFLRPTRQETPLDKVQQIALDQHTLLSVLLSYGTLHIYLTGGQLEIKNVPYPKRVRDAIEGITEEFRLAKPPKPVPPKPANPQLDEMLSRLATHEEVPVLPNADKRYEHRGSPDKIRRPLRTFGGPLRIPCDVHYDTDESTVMYIQRSKYLLAVQLVLPVLVLLAVIVLPFVLPAFLGLSIFAVLALLIIIGLIIINYVDDVFVLTNQRIIDIERKLIFLYEEHDTTTYDKIRDIKVIIHNIFELALDVGDVFVETPGSTPDIILSRVDHPFFIQDKIYAIKGHKEKADKAKAKNDLKDELHFWFGSVVTTLEKQMVNRGVPNLQKLDLWTAAERADEFGMKVVPVGEDISYPHIDSGKIVHQDPPPGSLVHVDPDRADGKPEIRVILSKRQ